MKKCASVFYIIWKDTLSHFRSAATIVSMPIFALITVFIFAFTFKAGQGGTNAEQNAGIIWIAFAFASTIGLSQAFVNEKENACLKGLLLCPVERYVIFAGKLLVSFAIITIMEAITTPVFLLLFDISCRIPHLIAVIVLTTLGLSVVGTLLSVISSASRIREILFPILFLPISIPVLLTAASATSAIFGGQPFGDILWEVSAIIAFDILFIAISSLVFEVAIEE